MGFSDFCLPCTLLPWRIHGLKEEWIGLLKTQLQQQLEDNILRLGYYPTWCDLVNNMVQFLHKQNSQGRMAALIVTPKF